MSELTLFVNEIFYSLCGEGARAGEPSIFVRLQGCSAKHACYASGVVCDTEFESGEEMGLDELWGYMEKACGYVFKSMAPPRSYPKCDWIVWTGGEPLDQLDVEILDHFSEKGYKHALETSGIKYLSQELADRFSFITVSPKVAEHVLVKNFSHINYGRDGYAFLNFNVHELRYVRHAGQPGIPQPSLKAKYYYLSPHSDGAEINQENLQHCIKLCLANPQWRLSVQSHKIWRLL